MRELMTVEGIDKCTNLRCLAGKTGSNEAHRAINPKGIIAYKCGFFWAIDVC
jgi:hypothetical protein